MKHRAGLISLMLVIAFCTILFQNGFAAVNQGADSVMEVMPKMVTHDTTAAVFADFRTTLVHVGRVHVYKDEPSDEGTWDDILSIRIAGCRQLYARQKELGTDLVLYINNIAVPNVKSSFPIPPDCDTAVFFFDLNDNSQTDSVWRMLLPAKAVFNGKGRLRVFISAGLLNDRPAFPEGQGYTSFQNNFTLIFFSKMWMYIFLGIFAVCLYLVWILCSRSELIKTIMPNGERVFSLSKAQMVMWTMLVVGSYTYIWIVTGVMPKIDGSVLILLGISVGTTTISRTIDSSNFAKVANPAALTLKSKGFIFDLLSDDVGISAHRLQNVLYTIVMAAIFTSNVLSHLEMPQFDSTLLALMGISSAGYLSLKPTELSTPQSAIDGKPAPPPTDPNAGGDQNTAIPSSQVTANVTPAS